MATSIIKLWHVRRIFNVSSPVVTATVTSIAILHPHIHPLHDCYQVRHYAARKFTRQKLEKKIKAAKGDAPETKREFVPYKVLKAQSLSANAKKRSERGKNLLETPVDNVYRTSYYKWRKHTVAEAIEMHRESHHPTMWNAPNALVSIHIELDLSLKKKNKFVDDFRSMIHMPHYFEFQSPRRILVICTRPEEEQQANAAGAHIVAGLDIIKRIQTGEVPVDDFDYVVSTPDIINDLVPLKGVLKKKFPSRQRGSLGFDIGRIVDFFARGVEYKSTHDMLEKEYGMVDVPVGKLQMPVEHLEQNIEAVIKEVCMHRSVELGPFVRQACLMSPPTKERINIGFEHWLPAVANTVDEKDAEDDESKQAAVSS